MLSYGQWSFAIWPPALASLSQATTLKEAHAGDPVAKKKLLKEQAQAAQQQQAAAEPAPSEPGKGELIDHAA